MGGEPGGRPAAPSLHDPSNGPWRSFTVHDAIPRLFGVREAGATWMVTFVDLMALMLTFFVLLYSMSQIEQRKWQGLADSLAGELSSVRSTPQGKPRVQLHIKDEIEAVPGASLDYLEPILRQQIATDPALRRVILARREDHLVVSVAGDEIFVAGSAGLAVGAEQLVFALAGLGRSLGNTVEVAVHTDSTRPDTAFASNWELSLARARLVTVMMANAGYRGALRAIGLAESRRNTPAGGGATAQERLPSDRVEFVVREEARESP